MASLAILVGSVSACAHRCGPGPAPGAGAHGGQRGPGRRGGAGPGGEPAGGAGRDGSSARPRWARGRPTPTSFRPCPYPAAHPCPARSDSIPPRTCGSRARAIATAPVSPAAWTCSAAAGTSRRCGAPGRRWTRRRRAWWRVSSPWRWRPSGPSSTVLRAEDLIGLNEERIRQAEENLDAAERRLRPGGPRAPTSCGRSSSSGTPARPCSKRETQRYRPCTRWAR
jgi:hypothetical protein